MESKRERLSKIRKAYWDAHPEKKEAMKKRWADPEFKAKMSQAQKEGWARALAKRKREEN